MSLEIVCVFGLQIHFTNIRHLGLGGESYTVPHDAHPAIIHEEDFVLAAMTRPAEITQPAKAATATAGTIWTGTPSQPVSISIAIRKIQGCLRTKAGTSAEQC
jgi:hypothetical protein